VVRDRDRERFVFSGLRAHGAVSHGPDPGHAPACGHPACDSQPRRRGADLRRTRARRSSSSSRSRRSAARDWPHRRRAVRGHHLERDGEHGCRRLHHGRDRRLDLSGSVGRRHRRRDLPVHA